MTYDKILLDVAASSTVLTSEFTGSRLVKKKCHNMQRISLASIHLSVQVNTLVVCVLHVNFVIAGESRSMEESPRTLAMFDYFNCEETSASSSDSDVELSTVYDQEADDDDDDDDLYLSD